LCEGGDGEDEGERKKYDGTLHGILLDVVVAGYKPGFRDTGVP
jgi:hypothetical protein